MLQRDGAAIGAGDGFAKGRDFAAWLGLVPKTVPRRETTRSRQDIEARQSLPAGPVVSGGLGRTDQIEELGALRAQTLVEAAKKRLHRNGWRSHSPTSWRASPGAFSPMAATSRRASLLRRLSSCLIVQHKTSPR